MRYFSVTDIGKKREKNEDSYFSVKKDFDEIELGLFMIADGMGGHEKGEFASSQSVCIVNNNINKHIENIVFQNIDDDIIKGIIYDSIKKANTFIFESSPKNTIMGTTFVLALILNEKLFIANVGDSRVYMLNSNNLVQITKDNSYVQQLIEGGYIDEEQAKTHSQRNQITRAIGVEKDIQVDFYIRELQKDDKILLCSDGLTTMVEDEDIKIILTENENPKDICEKLLKMANDNGGRDNITITNVII